MKIGNIKDDFRLLFFLTIQLRSNNACRYRAHAPEMDACSVSNRFRLLRAS